MPKLCSLQVRLGKSVALSLDSRDGTLDARRNASRRVLQTLRRSVPCAAEVCSMNYSTKVDEYNKEVHGLEKKDYSDLVEKFVTIK